MVNIVVKTTFYINKQKTMNKYYLKFKGAIDDWFFSYYDKETEKNVKLEVKNIAVTDVSYKVIGWDEESNSAIY